MEVKIRREPAPDFIPVELNITLKTIDEAAVFYALCNYTDISEWASGCGVELDEVRNPLAAEINGLYQHSISPHRDLRRLLTGK